MSKSSLHVGDMIQITPAHTSFTSAELRHLDASPTYKYQVNRSGGLPRDIFVGWHMPHAWAAKSQGLKRLSPIPWSGLRGSRCESLSSRTIREGGCKVGGHRGWHAYPRICRLGCRLSRFERIDLWKGMNENSILITDPTFQAPRRGHHYNSSLWDF